MNDHNNRQEADVLEQATHELRGTRIPAGPSPQLIATTVEALQALVTPATAAGRYAKAKTTLRASGYYAMAATILFALFAGSLWVINRNASISFAQVVENVRNARSLSFMLKQKIGSQPELQSRMLLRGNVMRYELHETLTLIVDTGQRKGVELYPSRKVAKKIDLAGQVPAEALKDPIDRLRNLAEHIKDKNIKEKVEQLADEELGGVKCHVYQVKGRADGDRSLLIPDEFELWVDAKTALPVRIHAADEHTSLLYEQFKWDEPLADELFSLEVPKEYRLDEPTAAVVKPGRIYYHQGSRELRSIDSDGKNPESQFPPGPNNSPLLYVSENAELSPDGRWLAMAFPHETDKGLFPPNRVLLWDRAVAKEAPAEVYIRPDGELQSWQFSADGRRLYVSWWEQVPGQSGPDGRTGADVVDLASKKAQLLTLPLYKDKQGKEQAMRFAAVSADGQTYLVVGDGLHVATADGNLVRRLTAADVEVMPGSVRLSPDGSHAVYATYNSTDRSHQLFVVAVAGGAPKELVEAGKFTDVRARWSPDGNRIAFTCRQFDPNHPPFNHGTETYLKLVEPDGSRAETLLTEKVHSDGPSLELTAWR